jgi:hypothetical protein
MTAPSQAPFFEGSFPHTWEAEILPSRPLILPLRHFVYPRDAEEVERGALEVLVRLKTPDAPCHSHLGTWDSSSTHSSNPQPQEFLATCALGFRDPAVPTGLWSMPHPDEICAVSGGYAYVIDTTAPERFSMIAYRPVLQLIPILPENLLLFVGHHSILAWGVDGHAWQSEKLSDEGVTLEDMGGPILHGLGWNLISDKETPFALDLKTGLRIPPTR